MNLEKYWRNKEYDGNDYIFVNSFINSNNKHQITLQNFEDFIDGYNFYGEQIAQNSNGTALP